MVGAFQVIGTSTYKTHIAQQQLSVLSVRSTKDKDKDDEKSCTSSRRIWLHRNLPAASFAFASSMLSIVDASSAPALAAETTTPVAAAATTFRSKAFDLKEYTNSITASKDTNVSPKEAYDVLAETMLPVARTISSTTIGKHPNANRALDVGAGAGVSTQTLYEMGFTTMDAIDWSGTAWNENVVEIPATVQFYEMDDERFFAYSQQQQQQQNEQHMPKKKYHVIVYNFAINLDKAVRVAKEYLDPTLENARLLVPANAQKDYWYKQSYYLIDVKGDIVWKSKPDVGAWSVQFQPDVTSDTCQGPWCPPYNGFVKRR